MATGKFRNYSEDILDHFHRNVATTSPATADVRIAWTTTAPSSTATGTELTGTGYTAGGTAIGAGAAVLGDPTVISNSAQIQWTNGSGGTWSIVGAVIHRGGVTLAATTAHYFLDSLTISVPDGATLTIAAGDLDIREQ